MVYRFDMQLFAERMWEVEGASLVDLKDFIFLLKDI